MKAIKANTKYLYGESDELLAMKNHVASYLTKMLGKEFKLETYHRDIIMSTDQYLQALQDGIQFDEISVFELGLSTNDTAAQMLRILERFEALSLPDASFNSKCEVHMPGQALSIYNETLLLENRCTDALQESLDSGWRIIAACPQPDARRPDYILGRYNPNRTVPEHRDGAKRSPNS